MMGDTNLSATVTVILPTYNRAAFLPGAFESLNRQSFDDWDLVVVDDGSTDNTPELVGAFGTSRPGRVRYVHQENRGAYAARNRGLDEATGKFIAFFDSDDVWLPHHLDRCVTALEKHSGIDWVFGPCHQVDCASGKTLEPNTFYVEGRRRPFLDLQTQSSNGLQIITDASMIACQILHGLHCGLQNSVIRRRVFDHRRFNEQFKVVDDELFVVKAMAAGARFAYFMDPHVIYQVHAENSSAPAAGASLAKHIEIYTELTVGLQQLGTEVSLSACERRALLKRLGREYFWHLGYVGFWQAGRRPEALDMFKRGLSVWPWDPGRWKTYLLARLKVAVQGLGE